MLAAKCDIDLERLRYPVLATPKFDGIRCITMDLPGGSLQSTPVCRSLKRVPNEFIFRTVGYNCPPGLDGELLTYNSHAFSTNKQWVMENFHMVQSHIMRGDGEPLFKFHVFDYIDFANLRETYEERLHRLIHKLPIYPWMNAVLPVLCVDAQQLRCYIDKCLIEGYEGVCFRHPLGPYKCGRSTLRQQWLVKYKKFEDTEAVCVGVEELYSNQNDPERNALGYQERSSHQANMVPMNTLGSLICECPAGRFKVGTGFDQATRKRLWEVRETLIGQMVKYRHQPHGAKDLPRIPVFLGFRDPTDMDPKPSTKYQAELL